MQVKTKITLGSFLLAAAGLSLWLTNNDDTPPKPQDALPAPMLTTDITHITETLPISGNQARSTTSPPPSAPTQEKQKIYKSSSECIGNMFYSRSTQLSLTPDERFSNLRWAVEIFAGKETPEILNNAAAGIGTDKAKLISELKAAAISVFKDTQTSTYKTNLDWLNHWNNLRIAHKYAGLTETGETNTTLSVAAVSYDEALIIQNRDVYAQSAAIEVVAKINDQLTPIALRFQQLNDSRRSRNEYLREAIDKMPLETKIHLREQIDLALYATDTLYAQDSESYLKIGMSADMYDFIGLIKRTGILDQKISDDFSKQCKLDTGAAYTPR